MVDESGVVRITNSQIYTLLLETSREVASVKQTVNEFVVPQVKSNTRAIGTKVDKVEYEEHVKKVAAIELRMYSVIIGVLMAAAGLNVAGIL